MLCANLEGANLRGCNFEDPSGGRANMEGKTLFIGTLSLLYDFLKSFQLFNWVDFL